MGEGGPLLTRGGGYPPSYPLKGGCYVLGIVPLRGAKPLNKVDPVALSQVHNSEARMPGQHKYKI